MALDKLPKEAVKVLQLGGKYAAYKPLKQTLLQLIDTAYAKLNPMVSRLSTRESQALAFWKSSLVKEAQGVEERKPPYLHFLLRKGMDALQEMNLVLKLADKNMGLTAMYGPVYRRGLEAALNKCFVRAHEFPHSDILRRLKNIAKLAPPGRRNMARSWIEYAEEHTEPALFYVIPKLHKPKLGFRPIAAAHSYPLAKLSMDISDLLNARVRKIHGIASNSKEVVNDLEQVILPEDGSFISFDVESMYPNMDIDDTCRQIQKLVPELSENRGFFFKALQLLLKNSYVIAQETTYRQKSGIATGTQAAPALANLYLHAKIADILALPEVLWSKRYIDDGIIYCRQGKEQGIIQAIKNIAGLTFTFELKKTEAIFLDLHIYKGDRFYSEGRLDIKPFFKKTNMMLFLPYCSGHPRHMKKGIARGEAIRLLRASTDKAAWLMACQHVFKGLLARGYPPGVIAATWKKIRWEDRPMFLGERVHHTTLDPKEPEPLRSYTQSSLTRDEDGRITLFRHKAPDRAVKPYTGFHRALRSGFHPQLPRTWKAMVTRHPLTAVLTAGHNGMFTEKRVRILQRWPPTILYVGFKSVSDVLVSAKQWWPDPDTVKRASRVRQRCQRSIRGPLPPAKRQRSMSAVDPPPDASTGQRRDE